MTYQQFKEKYTFSILISLYALIVTCINIWTIHFENKYTTELYERQTDYLENINIKLDSLIKLNQYNPKIIIVEGNKFIVK